MNDQKLVIGISWFQPEQWDRLIEISEDRDDLDDTYEDWRKNASRTIAELEAQGQTVQKIMLDLEKLVYWCNESGLLVNGKARSEYVSYLLSERNKKP